VVPILGGSIVALAIVYILIVTDGGAPSTAEMKDALVFLSTATLTSLFLSPAHGITLTPESAIIHQGRVRKMDWRGVAGISIEKEFGCRIVVIWCHDGQRVSLRAPTSLLDRKFDEKVKIIRAYWQARVGADEARVAG
jgi:hypothetical protein